jgi:hypothetical protein
VAEDLFGRRSFAFSHDHRFSLSCFNDQNKNPRHIYASQNRINELYFDYTHGPFWLRVGRQAIS